MLRIPFCACILAALTLVAGSTSAQNLPLSIDTPLPAGTTYDASIPTPQGVFGHEIGTRHTEPHQVVEYFRALAALSPRVELVEWGYTYEGRRLIHAVVTSETNQRRIEDIRRANLRLSDDPGGVSNSDIASMPAVALMGYSVHGNEASGTEAALLLLYHLAAGSGPSVDAILDNTVVIIDPLFNPDGRARFTNWVNRNRGTVSVADPNHLEHNEPWPGGRTNHYWFDLNRDWLPIVHPESEHRIETFHHWRPQVLTDFHEMGSEATYFFQPGIPSRTNPHTPAINQTLTARIGDYHARALDQIGALYYTRESFDDFYYGKGSTYPDVQGSVGILFEQASSRAIARETGRGILTYAHSVRNQFLTSLSTLDATVSLREDLLRYQRDTYAGAPRIAAESTIKAFVFDSAEKPVAAAKLAELLGKHRVHVHRLARDLDLSGQRFRAGDSFIVPVDQPQAALIRGTMERMKEFEDSLFYDVSTWTLPLAYGLRHGELTRNAAPYVGERLTGDFRPRGELVGGQSPYAYAIEWGTHYAPRALYRLLDSGVQARLSTAPGSYTFGGRRVDLDRGTIVVPVQQFGVPEAQVHEMIRTMVAEDYVRVHAMPTGLAIHGPDLGSRGTNLIDLPSIALIVGQGTFANAAGEAWHLLDRRLNIPVTLLESSRISPEALLRYNTILMTGGSYGEISSDALLDWVRSGGRLIASSSAVDWVVRNGLVELTAREVNVDSLVARASFEDLSAARGAHAIGGSIFEVTLDATHPIAYGYGSTVPVFRQGTTFYDVSDTPGTTVGRYSQDPLVSGYISAPRLESSRGAMAVHAQRVGRGRIILFADNPNFRGMWHATEGLFMNAIFFGGSF
jgi:hypothetical protein